MTIENMTYVWEVGIRAARHTETKPRDLRWFRGLWGMR